MINEQSTDKTRDSSQAFGLIGNHWPTPWPWRDPASIPPRSWLYGHYLVRGVVSLTVAAGGIGKTSLCISEALSMASGIDLLGLCGCITRLKVWVMNLEDPQDELDRRVAAACGYLGVQAYDLEGQLFVDSGLDHPLKTTTTDESGRVVVNEEAFLRLEARLRAYSIDVLIVDPFVSTHGAPESDNTIIDALAKRWALIAHRLNMAISLVHHTRKGDTSRKDLTADSARGAGALVAAARVVRVLQPMKGSDAEFADISIDDRGRFFCASYEKHNLSASNKTKTWFELVGAHLPNGNAAAGIDDDTVGVVIQWDGPKAFVHLDIEARQHVLGHAATGRYTCHVSAGDWIGMTLAEYWGMDLTVLTQKQKVQRTIAELLRTGFLKREKKFCLKSRRDRPFAMPGPAAP